MDSLTSSSATDLHRRLLRALKNQSRELEAYRNGWDSSQSLVENMNRKPKNNNRKLKNNDRKPKYMNRKSNNMNRKPKNMNRKPMNMNRKPKKMI